MPSIPWLESVFELINQSLKFFLTYEDEYKKLSFVCMDNCIEIGMKTYIENYLGKRKVVYQNHKKILDESDFWLLTKFLEEKDEIDQYESKKLNHYHKIRNLLYHKSSTIPKKKDLQNYIILISEILKKLFKDDFDTVKNEEYETSFLIEYFELTCIKNLTTLQSNDRLSIINNIIEKTIPFSNVANAEIYVEGIDLIVQLKNE